MSKTDDAIKVVEKYGAHNYHPIPVVLSEANGIWMTDVDGKKYIAHAVENRVLQEKKGIYRNSQFKRKEKRYCFGYLL